MPGCGYVCPQCEGRGLLENGSSCDWCRQDQQPISNEEWLKTAHEGNCCGDWEVNSKDSPTNDGFLKKL
ncbi:MAG: hypothetical protein ACK40G_07810 [Cytophagaceae bacterium]